ncbi:hypothetical protein OTU49_013009 [Cherax quadricarinatus]|uniref:Secreted protein n=1 Tax=Cherax quadricarinatus TaxID=27406 RepID=A0AAW0VUE5_CHEQU
MKRFRSVSLCFLCLAVCVLGSNAEGEQFDEPENYDYSYGDYRYQYEGEPPAAPQLHAESHVADPTHLMNQEVKSCPCVVPQTQCMMSTTTAQVFLKDGPGNLFFLENPMHCLPTRGSPSAS